MRTNCALVLVLLFAVLLRVPAFFQPDWYGDEGIFQAIAHAWLHGDVLYAQAWDNKPPGIFAVYAAGELTGLGMIAVRALHLVAMLAVQVLVFQMARRRAGDLAGLAAALLTGVLLALPIIEGQLANTESFLIVFTTLGMFLLASRLEAARDNPRLLLLPGVVFGLAGLFKQIGVFDAAAALLFAGLYYRGSWRHLGALVLGGLSLPLVTTGVFLAAGALTAFWSGNVGFMLQYRGDPPTTQQLLVMLLPSAIAVPYAISTRPWRTRSLDALYPLWLAFAAMGVTASGKAYPHYLIQGVPAFALVLFSWPGLDLRSLLSLATVRRLSVAAGMVVAALTVYHIFLGPFGYVAWNKEPDHTRDYYRNFVDYVDGDRSRQDYEAFFDPSTPDRIRLVQQVSDLNLQPNEIFVWGNLPWVYPEANLRDPTPFTVLFAARWNEGGLDGVARMLLDKQPPYLLVLDEAEDEWRERRWMFRGEYEQILHLDGAVLYRRSDLTPRLPAVLTGDSCYPECDVPIDTSGEKGTPRLITGAGD